MNSTVNCDPDVLVDPQFRSVTSPYDGSNVGEASIHGWREVDSMIFRAAEAFADRDNWLDIERRIEILSTAAELLSQQMEPLSVLATREGGKPIRDSRVEVSRSIDGLTSCCEFLKNQTAHVLPMGLNTALQHRTAYNRFEPAGPILAFGAFHHPINTISHQLAAAITTGCPVIVKPAKTTPLTCEQIIETLYAAGLPSPWCQQINLESVDVAEKMVGDERLACFSYFGSPTFGARLQSRSAASLRCVSQYDGAAAVFIDFCTADLEQIVPTIATGAFYHAGQNYAPVQNIYVHENEAENFAQQLALAANRLRTGDPLDEQTDVGPLIRGSELDRLQDWIKDMVEDGGELLCGGRRLLNNCFQPTVLFAPSHKTHMTRREIKGPVVSVHPYVDIDAAIWQSNQSRVRLHAAVFSDSLDFINYVSNRINAGSVFVNDRPGCGSDWMPLDVHHKAGFGAGGIVDMIRAMQSEKMIVVKHGR